MADKVYQQTQGYMPRTDPAFLAWIKNFSNLINLDWGKYGLNEQDAQIIANLKTQFEELYDLCQSPATRTTELVTQKDAIKASAKGTCRVYAQQIKANAGVDNAAKIALGIHIDDPTPTPIPAPDSAPLLSIVAAFSGEHVIRFVDENTPTSAAKPAGATQLELFVHVGPQPVANWQEATSAGIFTRNPIKYSFMPEDAGKCATYFARWRTARGLDGPMSLGTCMLIAFGGPVDQQLTQFSPTSGGGQPLPADGEDEMKIAA